MVRSYKDLYYRVNTSLTIPALVNPLCWLKVLYENFSTSQRIIGVQYEVKGCLDIPTVSAIASWGLYLIQSTRDSSWMGIIHTIRSLQQVCTNHYVHRPVNSPLHWSSTRNCIFITNKRNTCDITVVSRISYRW